MPIYILWPSLWGLLWSCLDFNSFQINAVSSVSLTSAIVSSIAVYQYKWAVSRVVVTNLYSSNTFHWEETHFAYKNATLKLDDQENTSVAIGSLIAIVSTIEVVFAVCAAWSSDSLYQPTQENQVSQVCDISYGATRNKFNTMAQKIKPIRIQGVVNSMVLHRNFPSRVAHVSYCLCWPLSSLSISSYWTKGRTIQGVIATSAKWNYERDFSLNCTPLGPCL